MHRQSTISMTSSAGSSQSVRSYASRPSPRTSAPALALQPLILRNTWIGEMAVRRVGSFGLVDRV